MVFGFSGRKHSPETKEKMRLAHLGKPTWNKGIPLTLETRYKMSVVRKGRLAWNKGITTPQEVREKIRIARLGVKRGKYRVRRK